MNYCVNKNNNASTQHNPLGNANDHKGTTRVKTRSEFIREKKN